MKRLADVVGIVPDVASVTRLVGAVLLEPSDERQLQQRDVTLEAMAARIDERPTAWTPIAA